MSAVAVETIDRRPGSAALSEEERRRISVRLGAGLCGLSLLVLGSILVRAVPNQWQIGELLRGMASIVVGAPILISGIRGVVTGSTRRATDQLVAIAVLAAASKGQFVTATLIPLFLELGRLFEERSSLGARAAIDGVRALAARQATLWREDKEESVEPASLVPGDVILVRPGERIPVDGAVLAGRAAVDQSAVTGESLFEDVGPGSPVFAGTVALDGLLRIRVRGTGADTVLGRVVALLVEVERATVPVLRMFESRASVWLPVVLTLAATTLFFTEDLSRAIAVLVVATPTALVVAGPAAMVAAMTIAARMRILIKSTDFLERSSDVDTLILDKTGTVTVGNPIVQDVIPAEGISIEELLRVGAACGFGSLHPVSRAVVAEAGKRGVTVAPPTDLQERPGLGVVASIGGQEAALGRFKLLADLGVNLDAGEEMLEGVRISLGKQYLGRIICRDMPRIEARKALDQMRALGINRTILLTGDKEQIANEIGEALGMDQIVADVLPEQKLEVVRGEQAKGRIVMMVGDGVNDALALGGADVGVAIGAEINEVALGGADVALLGEDLGRLPQLIRLADFTRRVIGQNVWLAFWFAAILVGLAVSGVLNPLTGALAQSIAVVAVVINSARILHFDRQG